MGRSSRRSQPRLHLAGGRWCAARCAGSHAPLLQSIHGDDAATGTPSRFFVVGKASATERAASNVAVIKRAIQDRVCLSGTHVEFRVRFAPHALGRDANGRAAVFGLEYGGMTLGRAHWVCFGVHRLRRLRRIEDLWRTGSMESGCQFGLTEVDIVVDDIRNTPVTRARLAL